MRRAAILASAVALLSSCNAITGEGLESAVPGYASSENGATAGQVVASSGVSLEDDPASGSAPTGAPAVLPDQVAAVPSASPALKDQPATEAADTATAPAGGTATEPAADQAQTAEDTTKPEVDPATAGDGSIVTAMAPAAQPKKQGFLAAFFSAGAPNKAQAAAPALAETQQTPKPEPVKTSAGPAEVKTARLAVDLDAGEEGSASGDAGFAADDLPGVRKSALFDIKRRSGLDDNSDIDIYEDEDHGPIQLAAAGGMARMSPNGLLRQTESVDVACLKPALVRVLKAVERHYGKKMMVTSGYRSHTHNRRARGAKNSLHMYCAAADVQMPGVSKWELATFARSMAGRGGVGTYCHTNSVHIDVGPERDWNWRCRRRRR